MALTAANGFSDYMETQILNWYKGTTFPAAPATTYLGLFTANPADTGSTGGTADGTEMTTTNGATGYAAYARQAIAWGAIGAASSAPISDSTGQQIQNSAQITFPANNGGSTVTVTGVGVYSAATAGNLLYYIALGSSQAYANGSQPTVNATSLTVAID